MNNNLIKKNYTDSIYTVEYDESKQVYIASWKTKEGKESIEISDEIADLIYEFKRENKSKQHEYERHIEHLEQTEATLHRRSIHKVITVEETLFDNRGINEILSEISSLTDTQRRRFLLNFNGFSLDEIAKLEGCSRRAVNYSIQQVKKIIKNFYKKF